MQIHYTDLATLFPQTPKQTLMATVDPLNYALNRYDISTGSRVSAFLAQAGHESMGFAAMVENLNYSADGLRQVFPRYFSTTDLAKAYARQPQRIASRVYANRMGNGNEASGDGWKFRGRGYFQLTGKEMYKSFALAMEFNLADTVTYLESYEGAAMSACWFWATKGLNAYADQGRFREITLRINGGDNNYDDRLDHYNRAKALFG